MTISEKLCYDVINNKNEKFDMFGEVGFIWQVAKDNDNWDLMLKLINKLYELKG